ncbi:MAG: CHASE3 domain-containing protein [Bacteroidota bacterium]
MRKSQLYSIAFGFSLLVLLSFSVLLYNSLSSYSEYSSLVEHTQVIMNNLQKVHSMVVDAETGQSGFLLTKDSSFLEPLLLARGELPIILDSLKELTADNKVQANSIDTLKAVIWERLHIMEEIINRAPLLDTETLTSRLKLGKARMDDFRRVINGIMKEEQILLIVRAQKKLEFEKITPSYFKAIISITAIVSLMQELKQRTAAQSLLETRFHALNRSNAELQQIAYVTSHDLQEPLRKIRTFSDALVLKYQDKVPDEVMAILKRIDANAFRVRELVADLSAFTSLSNPDGKIASADLAAIIETVQKDLSESIENKKAVITVSSLPVIQGYHQQLLILFTELLTNSLKFSKPGVDPVISITTSNVPGNTNELLNSSRNYLVVSVSGQWNRIRKGVFEQDLYFVSEASWPK